MTLSPADDAVNMILSENLEIIFDELVLAATGNITIHRGIDDSVFEAIAVDSGQVTGSATDTIAINPSSDFVLGTNYYVLIDSGAITDISSNDFPGISDSTVWNFTTTSDGNAPNISTLSPDDEDTDVLSTVDLVITFDEVVNTTNGNINIKRISDDSDFEVIAVDSAQVTGSGTDTITINPSVDMESETSYYVQIDSGAIIDLVTNSFPGISDTITWNFTIEDYIPPAVSQLSPLDNATGVLQSSNLQITFDEPVKIDTGNITIRRTVGNTVFETIPVGLVTGSGSDYTITDNQNNAVTVSAAARQTDYCQVHVDISGTFSGGLYKITVDNVQDLSTNGVTSPYDVASFAGEGGIPDSIGDGSLIEDPMGEAGTSFSMLASYKGRVYIGPADNEDRMYSLKPDGTDPQLITFTFTVGSTTTTSMNATNLGPDDEEGINYICGGTIGGTEYLLIGPHKETDGNLHYLYYTEDSPETGNTLNFYGAFVDNDGGLGGQTRGVSSMIVFNNNFYVGYPDTGGQKPYFHKMTTMGLDPTEIRLRATDFARIGAGANSFPNGADDAVGIDSLCIFDNSLYLANGGLDDVDEDGGIIRSAGDNSDDPGFWNDDPPDDWEDITPTGDADWYNSNTRFSKELPGSSKLVPSDKAFPAMQVFNGNIYMIRNTVTATGTVNGPQLWKADSDNNFTLIAENGTTGLTNMGDEDNTHATLLVTNGDRLYIGYDNANDGIQIWRTTSGVTDPSSESDFEMVSTAGFGDSSNAKIFNALSIADGATDYIWILCGQTGEDLSVYRTSN